MKCLLAELNAKVIARAIQSLAKIGNELFLEADQKGLEFRTLNSSRSAVSSFRFYRCFFDDYEVKDGQECYCKLAMKACVNAFRNMKHVEQCELILEPGEAKFRIQFKCRLETTKNALIAIVDEENITTALFPDDTPNLILGSHKLFTDITNNFNPAEEEITLEAQEACLAIKNYVEGARVAERFVRSQLKLAANEFEMYNIGQETSITFCLKEFKALLVFAETMNENISLHFAEAGSPVLAKIKRFEEVECTLIMSTLAPEDVSFYESYCRNESTVHLDTSTSETQKRKSTDEAVNVHKTRKVVPAEVANEMDVDSSGLFRFNGAGSSNSANNDEAVDSAQHARLVMSDKTANNIEEHTPVDFAPPISSGKSNPLRKTKTSKNNETEHIPVDFAQRLTSSGNSNPNRNNKTRTSQDNETELHVTFFDTEEQRVENFCDDNDTISIPLSPDARKSKQRTIFSRCFESTYVPREPSSSQCYAPDSDAEDN